MDDNWNISDMLHSQIICFCRSSTKESVGSYYCWPMKILIPRQYEKNTKIKNYSFREKHSKVYLILSAHSTFEQLTCLPIEIKDEFFLFKYLDKCGIQLQFKANMEWINTKSPSLDTQGVGVLTIGQKILIK